MSAVTSTEFGNRFASAKPARKLKLFDAIPWASIATIIACGLVTAVFPAAAKSNIIFAVMMATHATWLMHAWKTDNKSILVLNAAMLMMEANAVFGIVR